MLSNSSEPFFSIESDTPLPAWRIFVLSAGFFFSPWPMIPVSFRPLLSASLLGLLLSVCEYFPRDGWVDFFPAWLSPPPHLLERGNLCHRPPRTENSFSLSLFLRGAAVPDHDSSMRQISLKSPFRETAS